MTKRFMNMMRAVSQGMNKTPPPPWVDELPWYVKGSAEAETLANAQAYYYMYDREMQLQYRMKVIQATITSGVMAVSIMVVMLVAEMARSMRLYICIYIDDNVWNVRDLTYKTYICMTVYSK